jgi:hypothetical protein
MEWRGKVLVRRQRRIEKFPLRFFALFAVSLLSQENKQPQGREVKTPRAAKTESLASGPNSYKCFRMNVAIFQASIAFQGIDAIV